MDGNLQAILSRRERTLVRRVVVAVRKVRAVEIELVEAGSVPVDVEEPSSGVGLGAARQVAERDEEARGLSELDEGEQRQRLTLQGEMQRADAAHLPVRAGR